MVDDICHCYVDTNTFLHFQFFTEIDWCEELKTKSVNLIVCSAVIKELDQKKFFADNSKIQKRARKVIKKFHNLRIKSKEEFRSNVKLIFTTDEPTINWKEEGLDPDSMDDRIMANIINYKSKFPNEEVVLVTADLGLRLKAENKKIHCSSLQDNLLLPKVKSKEEKEIIKLEKEVGELQKQLPELKLFISKEEGFEKVARFQSSIVPEVTQDQIEEKLSDLQKELAYSSPNLSRLGIVLPGLMQTSNEELIRYKQDCRKYIQEFRKYLLDSQKHNELSARTIQISFVLVNEGNAPAQDIDVILEFPKGFEIVDETDFSQKPEEPEKPKPPRATIELLYDIGRFPSSILSSIQSLRGANSATPRIRVSSQINQKSNGYEVIYQLSKLKHYMQYTFEPIFIIFSSFDSMHSFGVRYTIIASNLPKIVERNLSIVIENK